MYKTKIPHSLKTTHVYSVGLAALVGIHMWASSATSKLGKEPVHKLSEAAKPAAASNDANAFAPVWVKQKAAVEAEAAAIPVDHLFKSPEELAKAAEPVAPPEPDYAELVKQAIVVDAVADNGAIINGRFYAIGTKLDEYAVDRAGRPPIVPILKSVGKDTVNLTVASKVVSVKVHVGGQG